MEMGITSGNCAHGGTIPAEENSLTIKFCPSDEKLQNINVSCNIRRKPHNLSLNLKGEGTVFDTLTLLIPKKIVVVILRRN